MKIITALAYILPTTILIVLSGCAAAPAGHDRVQAVDISATSGCQRLGRLDVKFKRRALVMPGVDARLHAESKAAQEFPLADTVAEVNRQQLTQLGINTTWKYTFDAYRCL